MEGEEQYRALIGITVHRANSYCDCTTRTGTTNDMGSCKHMCLPRVTQPAQRPVNSH